MVTIVLGPVRSGKSARAAALARESGKHVIVVATAALDPHDAEMRARVERHRRDRPPDWTVVETAHGTPLATVVREARGDTCLLVDALGTWLAALLLACGGLDDAGAAVAEAAELLDVRGAELIDALASTAARRHRGRGGDRLGRCSAFTPRPTLSRRARPASRSSSPPAPPALSSSLPATPSASAASVSALTTLPTPERTKALAAPDRVHPSA